MVLEINGKYPNIPTTNDQFLGGGGGKLLNTNCDQTTKWKISKPTKYK